MKNNSGIAMLVGLLGFAVCVLSIIYIAKPNFENRQAIEAECLQLQARLQELQAKQADREKYEAGIVEYTEKYESILNAFPADLNQEITIMFLQGIKDDNDFDIASLGLGEKEPFYTLGNGGADATLGTAGTSAAGTEAAGTEATTEAAGATATTEAAAGSETGALVEGGTGEDPNELVCYSAEFPITYTGSYKSLKDVVSYIDNFSDRMTVDSLKIKYKGDGIYRGDMDLS